MTFQQSANNSAGARSGWVRRRVRWRVFHRRWLREAGQGNLEAYPGAKHLIAVVPSEAEAAEAVRLWNTSNEPGRYDDRAFYESID